MSKSSASLLTYQYRLYPRRAEQTRLDTLLYQGKLVYNFALEVCKNTYEATGEHVKALSLWRHFRDWRNSLPEEERYLNASSLQYLLRRLDKAYAAFFRHVKAGEKAGHPRFKPYHRFNSVEYTYGDGVKLVQDGSRMLLYVHRVGNLKVKFHRPLPEGAVVKHVVLKRKASGWYANLQLEVPTSEYAPNGKPPVAGDVGLLRLLTLSDGTAIDNPRWLRRSLSKLRRAQRRLSRRQKGSNRRRKARQQVALLHEHVANTRRDFWHKTTTRLVTTYGALALEDLTLGFLLRPRSLSLSAHDAGLGMFYALLDSKAENAGCAVVRVDPAYTSQICSRCGCMVEKDLSIRVHDCPHCGLCIDRDLNAARNIFTLAFQSAWTEPSGVNAAPLLLPSGNGKRTRSLRSPLL